MRFTKEQNQNIKDDTELILNEADYIHKDPERLTESEFDRLLQTIGGAMLRIRGEIISCKAGLIDKELKEAREARNAETAEIVFDDSEIDGTRQDTSNQW